MAARLQAGGVSLTPEVSLVLADGSWLVSLRCGGTSLLLYNGSPATAAEVAARNCARMAIRSERVGETNQRAVAANS